MKKTLALMLMFALVFTLLAPLDGYAVFREEDGEFYEDSYYSYLMKNGYGWVLSEDKVSVDIYTFETSDSMTAAIEADGVATGDRGSITWSFFVPNSGFYNLKVKYYPLKGTNSNIQRSIMIDGETPFKGMEQIVFHRIWNNSSDGTISSKNGNEIRPVAVQAPEWRTVFIDDPQKRSSDPYVFYLSQGNHTITFESVKEPLKIGEISFEKAPQPKPYKEVIEGLKAKYPVYDGVNITYQAERTDGESTLNIKKSSASVGVSSDYSSPYTVPYHPYQVRLNTMGGDNWKIVGDFITWEINVPKEGLYQLSFRGRQSINRGVMSFRALRINGEVPFKEAQQIGFGFSAKFTNYICQDENGEPYLFYFKEGKNTVTLETVLGGFGMALTEVEQSLLVLNEIYRKTVQIIGIAPDKFIDYEIEKKIPDFKETMEYERDRLSRVVDSLIKLTGEKGEKTVIIEKMAIEAQRLAEDPESVVTEISTFKSNISALGTWVISISEMPLEIDSFTLSSPGAKLKKPEPNFIVKAYYETLRFLSTFFVDETKIATDAKIGRGAVKVWVSTGRDQAQIIRNLIDDSYTPNSGIPVDLQLIPADVILPATLAGNGPDVVLNVAQSTVINFAMRNALVDLSKLEGFKDQAKNFYPSAFEPVTYQGGIYGMPEQQNFLMLFCRDDILKQLGIPTPRTWEDVEKAIPVLHMNNYDFYIPETAIYSTLVYQYGGDMYKGSGNDYGIESGLYDEPAMQAFKKLTEFFTNYKLPVRVDFSNRFRTGEIPMGIAGYSTFNQLEVFAPEIRGLWSFYPIPGTVDKETGEINNVVVSDTVNTIMLKGARDKEKAWDFIKWWLSVDTQVSYANTLEAIMGAGARYATANREVLKQLPWTPKSAQQLLLQFEKTKGVPEVPGGYMTSRMVDYAYKAVVSNGENPRVALYLNIKDINKELTKKRKEFHLSYK